MLHSSKGLSSNPCDSCRTLAYLGTLVNLALCGAETGGSLGLASQQPSSRSSERPCPGKISWKAIEQDARCPPLASVCTQTLVPAEADLKWPKKDRSSG